MSLGNETTTATVEKCLSCGRPFDLVCVDCRNPFEITTGEIAFLLERGLNLPRRCRPCRAAKKEREGGGIATR